MSSEECSTAVDVQDLSVSFTSHQIVNRVNTQFKAKAITVLVGRSGSGKTTFLRALNRLNEEYEGASTTGQIRIDFGSGLQTVFNSLHRKEEELDVQQLRQKVGMLFQTPQLLPVSIYRNIEMPLSLVRHYPKQEIEQKVTEVMQMVGLWEEVKDRLGIPASRLSGGQQQRLCLARTLALEPTVLLLDEPTSSLDVQAAAQIEKVLLQLKQKYTIIMVSHDLKQAIELADDLLIMKKGQIEEKPEDSITWTVETLSGLLGSAE